MIQDPIIDRSRISVIVNKIVQLYTPNTSANGIPNQFSSQSLRLLWTVQICSLISKQFQQPVIDRTWCDVPYQLSNMELNYDLV